MNDRGIAQSFLGTHDSIGAIMARTGQAATAAASSAFRMGLVPMTKTTGVSVIIFGLVEPTPIAVSLWMRTDGHAPLGGVTRPGERRQQN
jgi:hypothetical protein